MTLSDRLRSLRSTLGTRPLRTALTILGIVIGSGSLVMLAGLLHGADAAMQAQAQDAAGADLIQVERADVSSKDREKTTRALSRHDAAALRDSALFEGAVIEAQSQRGTRAYLGRAHKRITLVGGTPSSLRTYRLALKRGRYIDEEDLQRGARVAVVGHEVWTELLEGRGLEKDVFLTVEGVLWRVVGVLEHKPTTSSGDGTWIWDRKVVVPRTAYDAAFTGDARVGSVFVRIPRTTALEKQLAAFTRLVEGALLRRHFGVVNFKLGGQNEGRAREQIIQMVVGILLIGTGLLAMFVGGINIMNIMLVTVRERMREIGIRRAIGATRREILLQFLLESVALAACGGLIGVAGGIAVTWGLAELLTRVFVPWPFHVETWSVLLALSLSSLTGVVFGLLPAVRAARLAPVDALRT